jgi:hypothetical protein
MKEYIVKYEYICNQIVKRFAKKQELDFDGWVGNEVGGIASFASQYFFSMEDIILDLKTKQKKGFILEWQNDMVEYAMSEPPKQTINYKSYTLGLRM